MLASNKAGAATQPRGKAQPDDAPKDDLATRMAQAYHVGTFSERAQAGLGNPSRQQAVDLIRTTKVAKRRAAIAALGDFDGLRTHARQRKDHALAILPTLLTRFEQKFVAQGGHVHWAETGHEACSIIEGICREVDAKKVVKSKSMITEEIDLNAHLEQAGIFPLETDLGEYIIQLRKEKPSHIIAPSLHVRKAQVAELFHQHHTDLPPDRSLESYDALLQESRAQLRQGFLEADLGITGANMLIAETGHAVVVTNEGNADLSMTLPRTHIIVTSIDKVVESMTDATAILRLLARSATGQPISAYTTFVAPRGEGANRSHGDLPTAVHLVLVDGGRSAIYNSAFREVLRCIRCGACMNHCPIYHSIGGHAYGWVYPGPIGAVLTPLLAGLGEFYDLPHASSFCGRCVEVCPMDIPLTDLMRQHRVTAFRQKLVRSRHLIRGWGWLARRARVFHTVHRLVGKCAHTAVGRVLAGRLAKDWCAHRTLPMPHAKPFMTLLAHSGWQPSVAGTSPALDTDGNSASSPERGAGA